MALVILSFVFLLKARAKKLDPADNPDLNSELILSELILLVLAVDVLRRG